MLYLDHNATTPVRPEVLERVRAVLEKSFGNPSSLHAAGREARALVEESRETLARVAGAEPLEIVFTSGGTEANRLALEGALRAARDRGVEQPHAVVGAIEHPSVLRVYEALQSEGRLRFERVAAAADGRVPAAAFCEAIGPATVLASLQAANNETGVVQDVAAVARFTRERGIALHVDAVQSFGKVPFSCRESGADLVALSGHKIGAPKGVGALWVRRGAAYRPPWAGGPQEQNRRPGTENVASIVGFATAASLLETPCAPLGSLLWRELRAAVTDAHLNGDERYLLPNTCNVSFDGVAAEDLLIRLDMAGVAASSGAACASGSREPSHVLEAMGLPEARIRGAVRFSSGWSTSASEVTRAAETIARLVVELRAHSSAARES